MKRLIESKWHFHGMLNIHLNIKHINYRKLGQSFCLVAALIFGDEEVANAEPSIQTLHFNGLMGAIDHITADTCGITSLSVTVTQNTSHPSASGMPTRSDDAAFSWFSSNFCTGTFSQFIGFGQDISISGNSQQLTASGTFNVTDIVNNTQKPLTLDLTFTQNGDFFSRGVNNNSTSTPQSFTHVHSVGTTSSATITGHVILDGVDLLSPSGTFFDFITSANQGDVTILRH